MNHKNTYRRQLIELYKKRTFIVLPKIVLVCIAMIAVVGGLYYSIVKIFGEDVDKITVAYVCDKEDKSMKRAMSYLTSNIDCKFKHYAEDEALNALEAKKVSAVLLFQTSSKEKKIQFIYSDTNDSFTGLFGTMLKSGAKDYLSLTMADENAKAIYGEYDDELSEELKDFFMEYLTKRNRYYKRIVYSDFGDLPIKYYYIGNAVSLILFLTSFVTIGFLKKEEQDFERNLMRLGITRTDIYFARYMPLYALYGLGTIVLGGLYQFLYEGYFYIPSLFGAVFASIAILQFVILVNEMISDRVLAMFVGIILSITFMFASGNMIPLSFLPEQYRYLGEYIFTKHISRMYGQFLSSAIHGSTVIMNAILVVWMLAISFVVQMIKSRGKHRCR